MSKVLDEVKDGQVRIVAAPHPFKTERVDFWLPEGRTVQEYLDIAQPDPGLMMNAHVFVGDQYVPRECWSRVRPKAGVTVTARVVPTGGGSGGKSPLRIFMMIAVMAIGFVVGPMLGSVTYP